MWGGSRSFPIPIRRVIHLQGSGGEELLLERARMLVPAAHVLAVSSYTQTAKDFPLVYEIKPQDWDFFLTVSAVFIAASSLGRKSDPETEGRVMNVVTEAFVRWNSGAIQAFEDCKDLYDRTYDRFASLPDSASDRRFISADSLGVWISWNLLGHSPQTEAERQLARHAGVMVTHGFASWWGE